MSIITTEDIYNFDSCPRHALYSLYQPPRISLASALNDSLRVGLLSGSPEAAKNHLMTIAANPGLAISAPSIYDSALHHSHLIEIIVAYLLAGDGAWVAAPIIDINDHQFQPLSYLRPACLRRVVLCSRWDSQRELEEINSWRTLADSTALGLPILINAISIGSVAKGMRPSVWTRAYQHPVAKDLRIQSKKEDGKFIGNWRAVYREQSNKSTSDWLHLMQKDNAFDSVVATTSVPLPPPHIYPEFLSLLEGAASGPNTPRRSNCFKLTPCIHSLLCLRESPLTPTEAGWELKNNPPV